MEGTAKPRIVQEIASTDAEDALNYSPDLLVRNRRFGAYEHAVLAMRTSDTGNGARSMIFADGNLLSNLLGNGATCTPHSGEPFTAASNGSGGLRDAHASVVQGESSRVS